MSFRSEVQVGRKASSLTLVVRQENSVIDWIKTGINHISQTFAAHLSVNRFSPKSKLFDLEGFFFFFLVLF